MSLIMLLIMMALPALLFVFWTVSSKKRIENLKDEEKNILIEADKKIKKLKMALMIIPIILSIAIIIMLALLTINEYLSTSIQYDDIMNEPLISITLSEKIADANLYTIDLLYIVLIVEYIIFSLYNKNSKILNDKEKKVLKYIYGGNIISLIASLIWTHIFATVISVAHHVVYKPVIYLYPEKEEKVKIKFKDKTKLTCTYPKYNEEWNVVASPDGTLSDENGKKYYSLYWEGINNVKVDENIGFCVKGEDTVTFLEEKLEKLGLNYKEAEEFIIYWLPQLEKNKYNYIYFKQTEEVNEMMPMDVTPTPYSVIRILMAFKPLNKEVNVKEQEIITPKRDRFTLVEWGGSKI